MAEKNVLSKHLQGKFELVGIEPGIVWLGNKFNNKKVDFRTMSLTVAGELHKKGCKYLLEVKKKIAK